MVFTGRTQKSLGKVQAVDLSVHFLFNRISSFPSHRRLLDSLNAMPPQFESNPNLKTVSLSLSLFWLVRTLKN